MAWVAVMIHGALTRRILGLSNYLPAMKRLLRQPFLCLLLVKLAKFVNKSVYNLCKSCHLAVKF